MGNPKRTKRRKKAERKKADKAKARRRHYGGNPPPRQSEVDSERLMPPVLSPAQIEKMFRPIKEAFADVGERGQASGVAADGELPDARPPDAD